jgi:recombination protein RecA
MNLDKLRKKLQDSYGVDSVMFANEMPIRPKVSSGSLALDFACGGGLPSDRCIEVAGPEGCGKTTLGLLAMANFLDNDPSRGAVILDTEHKLSKGWVEQLIGAERMKRVLTIWPDDAEEATDAYVEAVKSGQISFVLFDSIGGTPSKRVTEKSATIGNIGGNSLAITRFAELAKIYSDKYHCLTFGINQIREDMAGYHRHVTPGGKGWKFACVLRIQMKRGKGLIEEKINGEAMPVAHQVIAKVVKNQLAPEGRTATYWFINVQTDKYPFGIDKLEETTRLSLLTGVVEQRGAWYYHPALPGGQVKSREALMDLVKFSPDISKVLVGDTMRVLSQGGRVANLVAPLTDPEAPIDDSVVELTTNGLHLKEAPLNGVLNETRVAGT